MKIVKGWLLRQLLKKAPPRNFSLDDPRNDYVSVEMHDEGEEVVVIRATKGKDVICWASLPDDTESTRPLDDVLDRRLEFRIDKNRVFNRCYSLWTAFYFSFLWGTTLFRLRQSRYDKSLGQYRGRMEVLEAAILIRERLQRDLEQIEDRIRVSDVMKELYGEMIANSIRQIDIIDNVRMKLCSFLRTGEISTQEDQAIMREVVLNPAAYATLASYFADERRHFDNLKTQRGLIFATLLLALVAFIQLGTTLRML